MIRLAGLTVRYEPTVAVDRLDLVCGPGEWVCLIGPNGAGKSSVLRALAGLTEHEGLAEVGGVAVAGLSSRQRARRVALVPQQPFQPDDMTVADYVLLGRSPYIGWFGVESEHDRLVCAAVLDRLDLRAMAGRRLATLSGGEWQRLVLGRALAQDAPVLLLDEPTTALDLGHQQRALELVDELRRERGLTVLAAMHDLTLAGLFADRLVLLDRGRSVASGSPAAVLTPEAIEAHYGAEVEVLLTPVGAVVVVPVRPSRTAGAA